jgi:hypothetical protein
MIRLPRSNGLGTQPSANSSFAMGRTQKRSEQISRRLARSLATWLVDS